MKISKQLQDMTDKFLKEFVSQYEKENESKKDDSHMAIHFYLPQAIVDSKQFPVYKEQLGILMGMSEIDTKISQALFNKRIQGFVKVIENKLEYVKGGGEMEDFYIKNIVEDDYWVEDSSFDWDTKRATGELTLKKFSKKIDRVAFEVSNSRSGFNGKVVMKYEVEPHFSSPNDFVEKLTFRSANFFVGNERVMSINYKFDSKREFNYYEEGDFTHFKYVADINSFYTTILCI